MKKLSYYLAIILLTGLGSLVSYPIRAEAAVRVKTYSAPKTSLKSTYKVPKAAIVPLTKPVRVNGYMKSNGTYVKPYYKTTPNKTKVDNYSTKGNKNPFTGKKGYK